MESHPQVLCMTGIARSSDKLLGKGRVRTTKQRCRRVPRRLGSRFVARRVARCEPHIASTSLAGTAAAAAGRVGRMRDRQVAVIVLRVKRVKAGAW